MFNKNIFIKRRKNILKSMKPNSILIITAAEGKIKNGDMEYIYKQDSNFYYLTGLNIDKAMLILSNINKKEEFLFITKNTVQQETWLGKRMDKKEAESISGIKSIHYFNIKDQYINAYLSKADYLYLDYNANIKDTMDFALYTANKYRERFPQLQSILPANSIIYKYRIIKDKYEIQAMEKAIDITNKAIIRAMKNTKAGKYEYQIRAEIEYVYMQNGVMLPAFNSIVAAGKSATVLHYTTLDKKLKNDELILLDIGAEYMNYSADISRTYPVSGKFKGKQKSLYSALLDIQETMIDSVKPGKLMNDLQKKSIKLITKLLKTFKYIKNDDEYFKYYPHGLGHHLGLDTHDVSNMRKTVLKEGMVITIEPGVYIKEDNIGIRIEDDVLVTKKGRRNLSESIVKSIKDIEKIMR